MNVQIETEGQAIILVLSGRVDSAVAKAFEESVLGSFNEGAKVIIDFESLDYISSAGLRVILMAAKKLKSSAGILYLCSMKPHIKEVFDISGFSSMLSIQDTRKQALNAF